MHISKQKQNRQSLYTLKKHLYFFYKKILHAQKAQNAFKRTKTKKAAFSFA